MYPHFKGEVTYYKFHHSHHTFAEKMPLYPSFISFDFESMLPLLGERRGEKTYLHSEHILASAAISALIDGNIEKHCIIRELDETVEQFVLRFYDDIHTYAFIVLLNFIILLI